MMMKKRTKEDMENILLRYTVCNISIALKSGIEYGTDVCTGRAHG